MRRVLGFGAFSVALVLVAAAAVVIAGGREVPAEQSAGVVGDLWIDTNRVDAVASSPTAVGIQALDASERGAVNAMLSDQRIIRIDQFGATTSATINSRSAAARESFAGNERWVIAPPRAMLLDTSGNTVRTITVPPRTKAARALANGDLAFLTPGGARLIVVLNRYGLQVGQFGEPIAAPRSTAAQRAFLNEGTLLEGANGDVIVVFHHQPHPVIRRYSRAGQLQTEHVLRSPGLDRIAADAAKRQEDFGPDVDCTGGRITVYAATYDPQLDAVWVATASDDGIGATRVIGSRGQHLAQFHLTSRGGITPVVPEHFALGGDQLFWAVGAEIYRADVSGVRQNLRRGQRLIARILAPVVRTVFAQTTPPACGPAQTLQSYCPYLCGPAGSVVCYVGENGSGWTLESQHCLQPPTTPANFRGCEKQAIFCHTTTRVRETKTDRLSCGAADLDGDGWSEDAGDCNDGLACANPGAWSGGGTYCDVGACEWSDDDCSGVDDQTQCSGSPIVLDIDKNGFHLTNAAGGVDFDLNADGAPERWSWTSPGSDDAWLALDRNANGQIDNGQELFGNYTPQTTPGTRNGFIALAEYDQTRAGGNNDGVIDQRDQIFTSLRLWQDRNHNGRSEPDELAMLVARGVNTLSLDYRASGRVDQFNNRFAYGASVGGSVGRIAYDVFLVCPSLQLQAKD